MKTYLVLLRGINVGGKNKVAMATLRDVLAQDKSLANISTYIQSGNVILESALNAKQVSDKVESLIANNFTLDSERIKVVAIEYSELRHLIANAPADFGANYEDYRYDAMFVMDIPTKDLMEQLTVRAGIDSAWEGKLAIYFRRPSLKSKNATKSHLGKITQSPMYGSITIRSWQTVTKLLNLMENA